MCEGAVLLCANQDSDNIVAFSVDQVRLALAAPRCNAQQHRSHPRVTVVCHRSAGQWRAGSPRQFALPDAGQSARNRRRHHAEGGGPGVGAADDACAALRGVQCDSSGAPSLGQSAQDVRGDRGVHAAVGNGLARPADERDSVTGEGRRQREEGTPGTRGTATQAPASQPPGDYMRNCHTAQPLVAHRPRLQAATPVPRRLWCCRA